jgi:hypothetical protein
LAGDEKNEKTNGSRPRDKRFPWHEPALVSWWLGVDEDHPDRRKFDADYAEKNAGRKLSDPPPGWRWDELDHVFRNQEAL